MPYGDDEQMPGADGESIPECDDVSRADGVVKDDAMAIDLTERAGHR